MKYNKHELLKEIKKEIKVKATVVPADYTGNDFNAWSKEVLGKPIREKRKVSEQY